MKVGRALARQRFLMLVAGFFLAFCAVWLFLCEQPPVIGAASLLQPAEAHIGLPGEISLLVFSWVRPQPESWAVSGPEGWEFTGPSCSWVGVGLYGWQWQLSRQFWATQLSPGGALQQHYQRQAIAVAMPLPAVLPRAELTELMPVDDSLAIEGDGRAAGWIFALAMLCCLADALGMLWRYRQPRPRLLRLLAHLQYSPENALLLRRCWRRHSDLSIAQPELSVLLNRLCFQAGPGKQPLFEYARQCFRSVLRRNLTDSLHYI